MPFQSVDSLQKMLTKDVFHYAKDSKKAAGRALGTLVEIITFYLLKAWGSTPMLSPLNVVWPNTGIQAFPIMSNIPFIR